MKNKGVNLTLKKKKGQTTIISTNCSGDDERGWHRNLLHICQEPWRHGDPGQTVSLLLPSLLPLIPLSVFYMKDRTQSTS